jgi:hypothetical protein
MHRYSRILVAAMVLGLGSAAPALAQSWVSTYGTLPSDERLEQLGAIQQTSDGGYVLLGTVVPAPGRWHLVATKLDASGVVEWQWSYVTMWVTAGQIRQTLDGGYVIGATLGRDTPLSALGIVVLRLDAGGNLLWQRQFGGFERDIFRALAVASDGTILVGGEAEITRAPALPRHHLWLLKVSDTGVLVWQRTYGTPGRAQMASMSLTPDDGAVIAALDRDSIGSSFVIKTSRFGDVEWSASYRGMLWPSSIGVTADGGYVLAGTLFDGAPRFARAALIVRLDAAGNVVWARKAFDPRGTGDGETGMAARQTLDGGFALLAFTRTLGGAGDIDNDVWVVRLDAAGGLVWQSVYDNGRENLGYALEATFDNAVVVAGTTSARTSRSWDWLVLKLTDGGLVPGCSDVQESTGVVEPAKIIKDGLKLHKGTKAVNPLTTFLSQAAAPLGLLEACGKTSGDPIPPPGP